MNKKDNEIKIKYLFIGQPHMLVTSTPELSIFLIASKAKDSMKLNLRQLFCHFYHLYGKKMLLKVRTVS